jgi:hypothetical protein
MKKNEVNNYLNKGFIQKTKAKGLKKNKYRFVCDLGVIKFEFGYSLVNSVAFFSQFGFHFYSPKIDRIYSLIYGEQKSMMNLYANSQARLFDTGEYPILEYTIKTEADAQEMVDEVSNYILNVVLPEWEANPTIEYLEKKANEKLPDVPNYAGLILAKMVRNPDYEKIKQHFLNISVDWNEWNKESLQKVIDFLENHTVEELNVIANEK